MLNSLSKHQRKRELYEIAGVSRQAYFQGIKRSKGNVSKEKEIINGITKY